MWPRGSSTCRSAKCSVRQRRGGSFYGAGRARHGRSPARPWPPVERALRADRSMRQSLQDLFRFANPAHARENILHRKLMGRGTDAGHRIFHEDEFIASIEGGTSGRFDTEVRRNSTEHEGADSASAKLLVEFRAVKRSPLPLCNQ